MSLKSIQSYIPLPIEYSFRLNNASQNYMRVFERKQNDHPLAFRINLLYTVLFDKNTISSSPHTIMFDTTSRRL